MKGLSRKGRAVGDGPAGGAAFSGQPLKALRGLGRFAYDFVVGDDWRVAVGVVVALAAAALLARTGAGGWWLVPVAVVLLLAVSLRRATRR